MHDHTAATPLLRRRVTVVGAGVIGVSWTALFLAHGLHVVVSDPAPDASTRVRTQMAELTPSLAAAGLETTGLDRRLTFEADLATAVRHADVVQENGPENLAVKHEIWRTIEAAAPAHALFATSTSGIPASDIAEALSAPERLVVGHPFNPPHLVPLVEVVPGRRTTPEVVEEACAFYARLGKEPRVLRAEVPGFVANRLQSALLREAVHLVTTGVVDAAELDGIVTASIGPRWATAGPFATFHLGGGRGGLRHFLDHLGPALEESWRHMNVPSLDPATRELLADQTEAAYGTATAGQRVRGDRAFTAVLCATAGVKTDTDSDAGVQPTRTGA